MVTVDAQGMSGYGARSDIEHSRKEFTSYFVHIEVICGPVKKINETTFRIYPYECGAPES